MNVVSTFSGCGGSSLGYKLAGGNVALAVEWDDNAAETYRLNFPDTKLYHGDIASLTAEQVFALTGLQPGELDVFDGSPPCQGFSTAGRRRFNDQRNQLFVEYCRLLKALRPKAFIMENVPGMVVGKMRLIFVEILSALKACGYRVKARVLNAKYFGVPQSRKRLIFIGFREDLGIEPSHPIGRSRIVTAGEAVKGVMSDPAERDMLLQVAQTKGAYAQWHRMLPGQDRTDLGYESGFSCRKIDPSKPSPTITKTDGNLSMHGILHWAERRRPTVAEFKRFASFPDDFHFAGKWEDAVQRIGNTVPPLFMKAIAEHVFGQLATVTVRKEALAA